MSELSQQHHFLSLNIIYKMMRCLDELITCYQGLIINILYFKAYPKAKTKWTRNDQKLDTRRVNHLHQDGQHIVEIIRPRQVSFIIIIITIIIIIINIIIILLILE